nr:MAG: putative trypsin-like serine protease [Enontekio sobemovirus]
MRTLEDFSRYLDHGFFSMHLKVFVRDANTEVLMAIVMVLFILAVYAWKTIKFVRSQRKMYVLPSGTKITPGEFVEEKAMPNSSFENIKVIPSFQAMVMASLDGITYHVMGQCFWVDEGLVTAAHVIEGFEFLSIYRDEEHRIDVKPEIFEIGHGDYAVCRDPTLITQKLGLSKAKFSRLAIQKGSGLSVNVIAMGHRTIGFLEPHAQFGYVRYSGSTAKGFSGAPYYFGKHIFGMHLGSDSHNMGYDGAFLKTELKPSRVIKNILGINTEDSANWLINQLDRYEDIEYSRSPYNPDEYKVRVGGMYHIVDDEVMARILSRKSIKKASPEDLSYHGEAMLNTGVITTNTMKKHQELAKEADPIRAMTEGLLSEWGRTSVYKPESREIENLPLAPRNAMSFQDSGNLIRAPTAVVGARGMVNPQVSAQPQGLQTCSQMACASQTPLVNYHMESRTSTLAQQNVVSERTVRNRNRRHARQQRKRELEQYRLLYGHTQAGGVTLPQQQTQPSGSTESSTRP